MPEQNLKNHSRLVFPYHFVAAALIGLILVFGIIKLFLSSREEKYAATMFIILSIVIAIIWWYARVFALRAQDRAIRAEENFRHYLLTGKPLNSQLKLGQIIALRFAGDEEFLVLARRAVEENLSSRQIKEAITKWRGDYHRV